MKRSMLILAAVAAVGMVAAGAQAGTVIVNSFAATNSTPGVWGISDARTGTTGSTASIVNAPAGDPLGPGAGLITTDSTNASMGEVGVSNNYGLAGNIISSINLAYSYYKQADGGADPAAAPSIKLTFNNASYTTGGGDGYVTLIYEPYWNNGVGTVATDTWLTSGTLDATHGLFWENGGFGQASGSGGPPLKTLGDWLTAFNSTSGGAFSDATLQGVEIGMGTYNPSQHGYFDDVSINGTNIADTTYNFEPAAAVPLPASAWSGLALLGGLSLFGAVKRRRQQMV